MIGRTIFSSTEISGCSRSLQNFASMVTSPIKVWEPLYECSLYQFADDSSVGARRRLRDIVKRVRQFVGSFGVAAAPVAHLLADIDDDPVTVCGDLFARARFIANGFGS